MDNFENLILAFMGHNDVFAHLKVYRLMSMINFLPNLTVFAQTVFLPVVEVKTFFLKEINFLKAFGLILLVQQNRSRAMKKP